MDNYSLTGTPALNSGIHNQSGTGTLWAKESLSNQESILNVSYSMTDQTTFYTEPPMGNGTVDYHEDQEWAHFYWHIYFISRIVISTFGILGNGMVIWLLGCHIKKNHFTTYVLNLAIADFSFLAVTVVSNILYVSSQVVLETVHIFLPLFYFLYFSMLSTSQLLLAVISVDRCISVFFPLWHRCHRPTHLSAILCALIWAISFLPSTISTIFDVAKLWIDNPVFLYQFIVNSFLCLPLMTISSLMLFIKVCCKSKQRRRGKLLTTILVTVFFFFFFCFPFNAFIMISYFFKSQEEIFGYYAVSSVHLNSSVNPLIYYLVGRSKKGRSNKSMKAVLRKLFKEAEI